MEKEETAIQNKQGNDATKVLSLRSFFDLSKEIEHNNKKIIPIRELARIAGFCYHDFPHTEHGISTMNPKGVIYQSNIKRFTTGNFCAFAFSVDWMSFYYVSPKGKEIVKNQILLCQKLQEWGFVE